MDNQIFEKLLVDIEGIKPRIDSKTAKKLDMDLLERVIKRLGSFSSDCEECRQYLNQLEEHINELKNRQGGFENSDYNQNKSKLNSIITHLQKHHKLVTEGYYMNIYMSMGMSIGLVFGLALFKNIAFGLPIGMCIGMGIGSGMDADAKKKGLTI